MAINLLWGVEGAVSDGPPQFAYTTLFDYDSNSHPIYIGFALSSPTPDAVGGLPAVTSLVASTGPATSAACWAIKRLTYSGDLVTAIQWASGSPRQNQIWDNRASLSYQ